MTLSRSQKKKIVRRRSADPQALDKLSIFADLLKMDDEQRVVEAIASTEEIDHQPGFWNGQFYQGDSISTEAIEKALPDYMQWANVREMHQLSAVGTTLFAKILDEPFTLPNGKVLNKALFVRLQINDEAAWNKVKSRVYKGISIAGKFLNGTLMKAGQVVYRLVTDMLMTEISLVDRPANSDAMILLWKGDYMTTPNTPAPAADALLKAAADPEKVVAMLQALRNQAELDGDMDSAAQYTEAIKAVQQASGAAEPPAEETPEEAEAPAEGEPPADEMAMVAKGEGAKAQGSRPKAQDLEKAGRSISGGNASAIHAAIQSMAKVLAAGGDETATKIMACYGGGDTQKAQGSGGKAQGEDDLAKIVAPLKTEIAALQKKYDDLSRQPAPGGPMLRPVDKTIAGQPPAGGNGNGNNHAEEIYKLETRTAELRRSVATEPNPLVLNGYQSDLRKAEADLAALKRAA